MQQTAWDYSRLSAPAERGRTSRAPANQSERRAKILTPASRPHDAPRAGRLRVLVVDDNEDGATLLAEVLRDMSYDVAVADDAPRALALAQSAPFDIALLDVVLPSMDGYELARRLRELPGGDALGVVAITGYSRGSDVEASRAAGFDAHIVKPIDLDVLTAAIARCARRGGTGAP